MSVKVKICGITNEQDATWAVNLGANYLGFNFHRESPRKVSPALAARIVKKIPSFVSPVGVFVEQDPEEIVEIAQQVGLMGLQLHGAQTPEDCRALSGQLEAFLVKVFRVADEGDLDSFGPYLGACQYFLLDTRVDGALGGTGQTFPWPLAVRAKALGTPLFLAGGLTPENVAEAVETVRPFAVDVASGVERSPKRKDYEKMKRFIDAARSL